ncbi:MAG: hypothetical protein EKK57_08005 [Proteobacteria bacterium]|nr:MAG: hypothetical protein EKK57_08005 [Pseudomonadota bacterium]
MKIISKYKDYYDFVAKIYGEDPKIIFKRNPSEFKAAINTGNDDFYYGLARVTFDSRNITPSHDHLEPPESYIDGIIVCGKLYIMMHKLIDDRYPYRFEQTRLLTIQEYIDNYLKNSTDWWSAKIVALCNVEDKYINLNKKFNSPIVYFKDMRRSGANKIECTALTNISLLKCKFETRIDAYQIFQELQMFINNHLTPEIAIEQIDDRYKIMQHGFNKQSFRHRK